MHELSICDSIARTVTAHAGGRRVSTVRLRVGALRQVVPDTLVYCWSLTATGPLLQGSRLDVEAVPGEVACRDCGTRSRLEWFALCCPECSGPVRVVAGEELLVVSIDVEDEDEDEDEPTEPPSGAAGAGPQVPTTATGITATATGTTATATGTTATATGTTATGTA